MMFRYSRGQNLKILSVPGKNGLSPIRNPFSSNYQNRRDSLTFPLKRPFIFLSRTVTVTVRNGRDFRMDS